MPVLVDGTGVRRQPCWAGTPSTFETALLRPLPRYGIEELRQRLLFFATTTHDQKLSARVVLQMAFDTEMRVVLAKLIELASDVMDSNICERRRYLDIDTDIATMGFIVRPALEDLAALPNTPEPYVDLLRRYASSGYPRYRVCSLAVAVCLAVAVSP